MNNRELLVCDLDNTLYDSVGCFVPSFYAAVDAIVAITGCDREELLDDFREVHQKQGDLEQPFSLLELDIIKRSFRGESSESIVAALDLALNAFDSARKNYLRLHRDVSETLDLLNVHGVKLVAHTESKLFGVVERLTRLDLFRFFSKVYCHERPVSLHPAPREGAGWLERVPIDKIVELANHQIKPDPIVLLEICAREGYAPENSAYVGDSIARDILMAKQAGVFAIWAAYGAEHDPVVFNDLVRISHWTAEDIERERELKKRAKSIEPDYIARYSFAEVSTALGIGNVPKTFEPPET